MILPVIILTFVLSFPLSNGLYYGGQTTKEVLYDNKVVVACSYERNSIYYNSDSVSDNIPDDPEGSTDFQGVTSEEFQQFRGNAEHFFERLETHNVEIQSTQNKILELLIYISGFLLFFLLIELLRYIYKFFKMFF